MGLLLIAAVVSASSWAQTLLNIDSAKPSGSTVKAAPVSPSVYAPVEPPAASVPGTLYVPAEFERTLNETDAEFIVRMNAQQHVVEAQQKELLASHQAKLSALMKDFGPRPRTEADVERFAAYEERAKADAAKAKELAKRTRATADAGVTVGADEMLQPMQKMPPQGAGQSYQ
ncbi:hypothetical protein ACW0US_17855 [Xanthomonas euvesicatoria]